MPAPRSLFSDQTQPTLVVVSQVYVPDTASVGQHLHDVSAEMVRRGRRVVVISADSGHDDPSQRFSRYEVVDGVHVIRLPLSNFGKASLSVRLLGGSAFLTQALSVALLIRRIDHVLVSTSPPMCGALGVALSRARDVPLTYWIMDLNPDQIVATGRFAPNAAPVRAFEWINQRTLACARTVVVLDRYMRDRVKHRYEVKGTLAVVPPWPHVEAEANHPLLPREANSFRRAHGLEGTRVVMYSGNLSPVHPVTTFLEAAEQLRADPRLRIVFVGGGLGRAELERGVRDRRLTHVVMLPYQPLAGLRESLSAADVHLVSMGADMVGIVHPCKIYGAMAVGRPILALAPRESHIADLMRAGDFGWQTSHGETGSVARALQELLHASDDQLDLMGQDARRVVHAGFGRSALLSKFCDLLS